MLLFKGSRSLMQIDRTAILHMGQYAFQKQQEPLRAGIHHIVVAQHLHHGTGLFDNFLGALHRALKPGFQGFLDGKLAKFLCPFAHHGENGALFRGCNGPIGILDRTGR